MGQINLTCLLYTQSQTLRNGRSAGLLSTPSLKLSVFNQMAQLDEAKTSGQKSYKCFVSSFSDTELLVSPEAKNTKKGFPPLIYDGSSGMLRKCKFCRACTADKKLLCLPAWMLGADGCTLRNGILRSKWGLMCYNCYDEQSTWDEDERGTLLLVTPSTWSMVVEIDSTPPTLAHNYRSSF